MKTNVFFVHSVTSLTGLFNDLCRRHLSEVRIAHVADESLIQRALAAGGLTPDIVRGLCGHVASAQDAGADVIQVTCSSLSPAVAVAQRLVSVPVLTVDEPVARWLVRRYARIGVIATARSTLDPSVALVRRVAESAKRRVAVKPVFCEGAYDAFFAGDLERHDAIVLDRLRGLMRRVDAVLLAQVSMARVADRIPRADRRAPVFSSPEPCVRHLARVVARRRAGAGGGGRS